MRSEREICIMNIREREKYIRERGRERDTLERESHINRQIRKVKRLNYP